MWRKLLLHGNIICLSLTGLAWLVTIVVRFILLNEHVPPNDWLLWTVCNNAMIAGFAYQLGVISFRHEAKRRHWFRHKSERQRSLR